MAKPTTQPQPWAGTVGAVHYRGNADLHVTLVFPSPPNDPTVDQGVEAIKAELKASECCQALVRQRAALAEARRALAAAREDAAKARVKLGAAHEHGDGEGIGDAEAALAAALAEADRYSARVAAMLPAIARREAEVSQAWDRLASDLRGRLLRETSTRVERARAALAAALPADVLVELYHATALSAMLAVPDLSGVPARPPVGVTPPEPPVTPQLPAEPPAVTTRPPAESVVITPPPHCPPPCNGPPTTRQVWPSGLVEVYCMTCGAAITVPEGHRWHKELRLAQDAQQPEPLKELLA